MYRVSDGAERQIAKKGNKSKVEDNISSSLTSGLYPSFAFIKGSLEP